MRIIFIIIFLFFGFVIGSFQFSSNLEDPVRFEHLTVKDGLSQSGIYAILQDSRGFMWFGTDDGLNRYDGYTFTVYRYNLENYNDPYSITHSRIRCLYEDSGGFIWVGTYGGLNKYNPDTGTFIHFRAGAEDGGGLNHNNIFSICEDDDGGIWIGTNGGGLIKLNPGTGKAGNYLGPRDVNVFSICKDDTGKLWVSTGHGLNRFDPATGQVERIRDPFVRCIYKDSSGFLWLGSDSFGLERLDPVSFAISRHAISPAVREEDAIYSICMDQRKYLWVGTRGGLVRMQPSSGAYHRFRADPDDPWSISKAEIFTVCEDRSGIIWAGTFGNGIHKMNPRRNKILHLRHRKGDPNSLIHNMIFGICEEPEGVFWFGCRGGGLDRWERKTNRFTHYRNDPANPDSLRNNDVHDVAAAPDGTLWVGTNMGLDRFEPRTGKFIHYRWDQELGRVLNEGNFINILPGEDNTVWACVYYRALIHLDPQKPDGRNLEIYHHIPSDPGSLSSNRVITLHRDREGRLLVGTHSGGLNILNIETGIFTSYRYSLTDPGSLGSDSVMDIHEDRAGNLWLATYGGGLNKFDRVNQTFTRYTRKHGFPTNNFYGILEDDRGNLWLSSNMGISRFSPATGKVENYTRGDGLQDNEFNSNSFHKSSTGYLFFGGINGVNMFHPRDIIRNPLAPPVAVTSFRLMHKNSVRHIPVNGETVDGKQSLVLPYQNYVFSFRFAALDFSVPGKNRYAYKLEGLHEDWQESSAVERFVTFAGLSPGDYVFRVKASNSDGVWNANGASIKISILPPFWKTWWFRLLMGLILAAVLYGLHLKRVKKIALKLEYEARLERLCEKYDITSREREILGLLLKGKTNKEIEKELFISFSTVKNHVYKIFKKTGVKTRYQLIKLFGQPQRHVNLPEA